MKILITGGHVTPALACIDEIHKEGAHEVVFVGRRFSLASENNESFEYQEVIKRNVPFIHLTTGKIYRKASVKAFVELGKILIGLLQSMVIILKERPQAVLSFGGFIAVPIVIVAKLARVKICTHEQTMVPGLANRFIAQIADVVCISIPESHKILRGNNVVLTGNPIRQEVLKIQDAMDIPTDRPIVYVTGGSLGAHSINILIEPIIDKITKHATLVHQTGRVDKYKDFERLAKISENNDRYFVFDNVLSNNIGWILHSASLIISRSGANTVFEHIALKKPAILIPLPWAGFNEQVLQAELIDQVHAGILFDQLRSPQELYDAIKLMLVHTQEYIKSYGALESYVNPNAAKDIISHVIE